jgi:hypothetical protein
MTEPRATPWAEVRWANGAPITVSGRGSSKVAAQDGRVGPTGSGRTPPAITDPRTPVRIPAQGVALGSVITGLWP